MPPKVKITKEELLTTAVNLVRTSGHNALNARNIAAILKCSTQPIFSNFANMDDLKLAVIREADTLSRKYIQKELEQGEYPPYKASGMAYIRFAKEEKELFKLLYMRDRSHETFTADDDLSLEMETLIQNNTGIDKESSKLFHLESWAFVHGIATMMATGFLDLEWDLVSKMLTDCYQGLTQQYVKE